MDEQEQWMTTNEALDLLGISRPTLYRWIKKGRIRAERPRRAVLWQPLRLNRADVEALAHDR